MSGGESSVSPRMVSSQGLRKPRGGVCIADVGLLRRAS